MLDLYHPSLHLQLLPSEAFILRFPASHTIPPAILAPDYAGSFLTISRTKDETSIIYDFPSVKDLLLEGVKEGSYEGPDGPWGTLKVQGPFEFGAVGVMSKLSGDLAEKGVSLLAVGTCEYLPSAPFQGGRPEG